MVSSSEEDGPTERDARPTLRVLMVDDSAAFCHMVARWLGKEPDIAFRHCQDPSKAIEVATEFEPSLIIQDYVMPHIDGLEMIRRYRKTAATALVPVMVLSAEDSADRKTAAFLVGADDYVRKDAEHVEFLARIRYHAGRYLAMQREGLHRFAMVLGGADHKVRLLMVEPTKTGRSVLTAAFRREPSIETHFCGDDRAALRLADEVLPTVVVVSLFGGSYEAFDLIRRLRERRSTREVPIIVYTSTDDPELKARVLESGANDCALRSTDLHDLVARVKRHSLRYFTASQARFAAAAGAVNDERIRVVMVDNSGELSRTVRAMLQSERQLDFSVLHAPGQVLGAVRERRPALLLLNLDMPQVDTLGILRSVRDDPVGYATPVILMSERSDPHLKARIFALGANDHVHTDVDKIELVSRILHHARSHLAAQHLRRALASAMEMERRVEVQRDLIRRTFGRYLSDGVVDAILDDPDGLRLGGEARVVTLMMTDLRGFTVMSESQPPHIVIEMLNGYFEVMTRVLMRYEATIDEFVGDAILAIFGAPHAMEDHAERAVACAVAMQNAMTEVNEGLRTRGLPELEMGIGLNTGEVVVGNVGSERRTKYGVVGRHVNLTSRIESFTVGGQILASDSTVSAAGDIVRTRARRQVELKGIKGGITLHEVVAIGGGHNLALTVTEPDFVELRVPLAMRAFLFDGKARNGTAIEGHFVRIGSRGGVVETSEPLPLGDVQVSLISPSGAVITEDIFGKAVGPGAGVGTVELRFTSIAPAVVAAIDSFARLRR